MVMSLELTKQPPKLKFLLGHHLATKSFGLGRLFYKSSRQLQNFRRHGDQIVATWRAAKENKIQTKDKTKPQHALFWVILCVWVTRFLASLSGDIWDLK